MEININYKKIKGMSKFSDIKEKECFFSGGALYMNFVDDEKVYKADREYTRKR